MVKTLGTMPFISPEVSAALQAISGGTVAREVESRTLDFTTQQSSVEDTARHVAEMAACLANSSGGSVVLGIHDRASGAAAFVGCDIDTEGLRRRIWDLCNPHLTTDVAVLREQGKTLLVVSVPQGIELHAVAGRVKHRVGTSCEPMSSGEQAREIDRRLGTVAALELTGTPKDTLPNH